MNIFISLEEGLGIHKYPKITSISDLIPIGLD